MTKAIQSQNQLFSEVDLSAHLETTFIEDELWLVIKAKEREKLMSPNLFNVTQEQVDNPMYWINL
ncbi:hypothetical protein ACE1CI_21720 [Aerosakkonemataceae cyanobacterium BLCC-F50]|uniref:Uncharacterized protein n=1 Tax=Floridaenema flaviceps BLCC-F50 TaxID=3153642 RepID=A0ABV4XWA5_9CYAN